MVSSLPEPAASCSGVQPSEVLTVVSAPSSRRYVLFDLVSLALEDSVHDCLYPLPYIYTLRTPASFIEEWMTHTILVSPEAAAVCKAVAPSPVVHSIFAPMAIRALTASKAPHWHAW